MIKSDKGYVKLEGTTTQVLAEFSMIVFSLLSDAKIDKEIIQKAFEAGLRKKNEIHQVNLKKCLKSLKKLLENLKEDE